MSLQVFISYKSEYREFAREVKSRIHSWGYKSWLDVDEIPDGSYFRFEIDKGLKTSDVVVGVITQEAQESREVLFELDYAIKKNKPLLPLKYRDCELMYHLESIQWIDFTQDADAGFERLHNRLTQLATSATMPSTEPSLPVESQSNDLLAKFIEDNDKEQNGASLPLVLKAQIIAALDGLSERERTVLEMRFGLVDGQEHSRYDVAQQIGVANERIRQLETRALRNIAQNQRPHSESEASSEVALMLDGTPMTGGLMEDAILKPSISSPVAQPSAPILPPMQAAPMRQGSGIFAALAGILMLPFAGIAALFGWLRSSGRDEAELARTNRAAMLSKVQEFWVVGVLDNALKESGAFDLGLSAAPGAVLKHIDYGDYALPTSAKIGDVFNDLNRELLILGAPGAGKTIMLLQLARDLIQQAQTDPNLPMPAVFNLSSWAAERKPLEAWLVDELRLKYQVPKKVAQTWVENEQLTLLLDGLDEVAEDYRNACVDSINAYRQKYAKTDLAVCSRIADYDVLTSKLDLRGAITLQPLSMEQVNHYIDRPELAALRETLQTDATLQEMAGTPFLLNTMAYSYQGQSVSGLKIPDSGDPGKTRRTHLFNTYIEKRLSSSSSGYSATQTRHYLKWLAEKMVAFKHSVYFIENLQPEWLTSTGIHLIYRALTGLSIAAIISLVFAFGFDTKEANYFGVIRLIGLVVGLYFAIRDKITRSDTIHWSFNRHGLILGVVLGGIAVVIIFRITDLSDYSQYNDYFGVLINLRLVLSLAFGIILGTSLGIVLGFFLGLRRGKAIQLQNQSNHGIRLSAHNALKIGFVYALIFGGAFVILYGLTYFFLPALTRYLVGQWDFGQYNITFNSRKWTEQFNTLVLKVGDSTITPLAGNLLILSPGIGASLGIMFGGGASVIKHILLRTILSLSGNAPLNYARFLDYCASIQILRKVGGGYIFVHRYLLEYFAELEA